MSAASVGSGTCGHREASCRRAPCCCHHHPASAGTTSQHCRRQPGGLAKPHVAQEMWRLSTCATPSRSATKTRRGPHRHHPGQQRSPAGTSRQATGRVLSTRGGRPFPDRRRPSPAQGLPKRIALWNRTQPMDLPLFWIITGQPRVPSRRRRRGLAPPNHARSRQPRACAELHLLLKKMWCFMQRVCYNWLFQNNIVHVLDLLFYSME